MSDAKYNIGDEIDIAGKVKLVGIQTNRHGQIMYQTDKHFTILEHVLEAMRPAKAPEPSKQEPIKLYCIRDFIRPDGRKTLTKGKVYTTDEENKIEYDSGNKIRIRDIKKQPQRFFPLVKRPAKVGEIILPISPDGKDWLDLKRVVVDMGGRVLAINVDAKIPPKAKLHFDGWGQRLTCDEYLVLDGYRPEMEYYTGKVVCVQGLLFHTAGKVYDVKTGVCNADGGIQYNEKAPAKTLEELNAYDYSKFIPYKGEA